jgi:galactose mutarotase-like enzyme
VSGPLVELANERVALALRPAFGARICTLTDRRTGRQWLVDGEPCEAANGASYRGREARGWDECFPTVAPCRHPAWHGVLRDHGELWGRPWTVAKAHEALDARFEGPDFRFERRLELEDAGVRAHYRVTATGSRTLPYLWSQHCLLAARPDERIRLTGVSGKVRLSGGRIGERRVPAGTIEWPALRSPDRDLTVVGSPTEGLALKAYADIQGQASAELSGAAGGIRFSMDGGDVRALGLWLDYGGWPEEGPVHQVALEPASAGADDLAAAEDLNQARRLEPGASHEWSVRLTLLGPGEAAD